MKKYLVHFLSGSKILLLALMLVCAGCPHEPNTSNNQNNGNTGNTGNNGNTGTIAPYKFSAPQNINRIPQYVYYQQRSFITTNHIYNRISSNVSSMFFDKDGSNNHFGFTFPNEPYQTNNRPIYAATGPFCVDKNEQYMYVVDNHHLYKCNLSTSEVMLLSGSDFGSCLFIKAMDNGDLIFTSDLNNGSIQKVESGSSTITMVASNLGATPVSIDVLNNELYFTLDLNNGSVKKISGTGNMTTVVDNLTHPSRLAFDKNGNFILETQVTLDGNNYGQYSIYKNSGSKIIDISDDKNLLILSALATETMVPLYVDSNNNLFFGHYDYVSGSAINHCNPFIDGNYNLNIYKILLMKQ